VPCAHVVVTCNIDIVQTTTTFDYRQSCASPIPNIQRLGIVAVSASPARKTVLGRTNQSGDADKIVDLVYSGSLTMRNYNNFARLRANDTRN
jgi:hypothetical protein